ncbi:MAG: ATP-binding protein [Micromonosporaceae bacterium]
MTSFVGRRAEIAEVRGLVEASRLVTITGPGGVGKSRIALRAAGDLSRRFPDGVWVADLSSITRPVALAYTIADVLRLHDRTARSITSGLAAQMAGKHLLLILETCEHLIDACAPLAEQLLHAAPKLRIIATSRQRLGTSSEHVLVVEPLAVPAAGAEADLSALQRIDAVALFTERARAVSPAFSLSRRNGAPVAALCRRLGGLPLAIEHAAARLHAFSVDQLVERLDDGVRLLDIGRRGGVVRHQTMRATIRWSEKLCTLAEGLAWARLSVFPGSFGLEAAEWMCSGPGIPTGQEMDVIAGLVDKSIILAGQRGGEVRYRLLDDFRAYGRERARVFDAARELGRRHRDWCLELARIGERKWSSGRQLEAVRRLDPEHANFVAALEFCAATPGERWAGVELAATLWFYWICCGRPGEGRYWLDRAIEEFAVDTVALADDLMRGAAADRKLRRASFAKALWARGYIAILQGDATAARRYLEESCDHAASARDDVTVALSTQQLGLVALLSDDPAKAELLFSDALARHEKHGEPDGNAIMARAQLAMTAVVRGELDMAVQACREAGAICEESGERWAWSRVRYVHAVALWAQGDAGEAALCARESLRGARMLRDVVGIVLAIELIALAATDRGGPGHAAILLGAADGIWRDLGLPMFGSGFFSGLHELCLERTRKALSEKEYAAASAYGAGLSLDEAVTRALADSEDAAAASLPVAKAAGAPWPPLSNRECQVAALVADGLCNREIAQRLLIAKRTADAHVEHILAKLSFSARTQVAAWVAQQRADNADDADDAQPGLGAA